MRLFRSRLLKALGAESEGLSLHLPAVNIERLQPLPSTRVYFQQATLLQDGSNDLVQHMLVASIHMSQAVCPAPPVCDAHNRQDLYMVADRNLVSQVVFLDRHLHGDHYQQDLLMVAAGIPMEQTLSPACPVREVRSQQELQMMLIELVL